MTLPFSQSCENNKDYILAHLLRHYTKPNARVLEIAGQEDLAKEKVKEALKINPDWQRYFEEI